MRPGVVRALALALIYVLAGCAGVKEREKNREEEEEEAVLPKSDAKLGMVVIDVQETFVSGAVTPGMDAVLARIKGMLQLAEARQIPFFITYEDAKTGSQALHQSLVGAVPKHAQEFVKTTFAATGLREFREAIAGSGLSHFVVLGAETDVCVLQTVLGLRQMGHAVLLQTDAAFTSESNPSPALRRMLQAGVTLVDEAEVLAMVEGRSPLPPPAAVPVTIVKPLETAIVINALSEARLGLTSDVLKAEKLARLRELLLISEWFEIPVYATGGQDGLVEALPASLQALVTRGVSPAAALSAATAIHQIFLAGTDQELEGSLQGLGAGRDVFLVEDALLESGTPGSLKARLAPLYAGGIVPLTYKTAYYESIQSVSRAEWPSQRWVERIEPYYDLTVQPESLPPIADAP